MSHFNYKFLQLVGLTIFVSFVLAIGIFVVEASINPTINTFMDILHWWIATITTVGASNIYPVTTGGQVLASLSTLSGTIMYFAVFSEVVLWIKHRADAHVMGLEDYKGSNHVVIVGYNMMAFGLINLLDKVLNPDTGIVLITNQLATNPIPERVHFIKSVPATGELLQKTNITTAKMAFILSDDRDATSQSDINTILIAGMIEDLSPNVVTIAEILDQRKNKSELESLHIDHTITFNELLTNIREQDKATSHKFITKLLPKEMREGFIKPEYV